MLIHAARPRTLPCVTTAPRSRRTSSHRKGDANELAILETLERLLAETPLGEISIAELAAGAGISRSSFYFYFGSKDEVLMTLVDRLTVDLERVVRAMAAGIAEDPRAGLTMGIEATAQLWRDHGPVLVATSEAGAGSPELSAVWNTTVQRFIDVNAEMIRAERRRGAAPADGPSAQDLATSLIWLNVRSLEAIASGVQPAASAAKITSVLTEIWLRAIYGVVPY
jgi:TetR/AcrR family transcriptional regulator, ethionamide resistance regulator